MSVRLGSFICIALLSILTQVSTYNRVGNRSKHWKLFRIASNCFKNHLACATKRDMFLFKTIRFSKTFFVIDVKGQLISKCLLGIFNTPKKRKKSSPLLLWYLKLNFFVYFLGELKTAKRHFEINWPLKRLCITLLTFDRKIKLISTHQRKNSTRSFWD